jgi:hypothetical protein
MHRRQYLALAAALASSGLKDMNIYSSTPAPDESDPTATSIDVDIKSRQWVESALEEHYDEPTILPLDEAYALPVDMETAIAGAEWLSATLPQFYRTRGQDCDDFAFELRQAFSAGRTSVSVGVAITDVHAWTTLVTAADDPDERVQDWEPQPTDDPQVDPDGEPYQRDEVFVLI